MDLLSQVFEFLKRVGAKQPPRRSHSQRAAEALRTNPASGLPLINDSTIDVSGNALGINRINRRP